MSLLDLLREAAERPDAPVRLIEHDPTNEMLVGYAIPAWGGDMHGWLDADVTMTRFDEWAIAGAFLDAIAYDDDATHEPYLVGVTGNPGEARWQAEVWRHPKFTDDSPAVAVVLAWLRANPKEEA